MTTGRRLDIDGRSLAARMPEIAAAEQAVMVIGRPVCPACQVTGAGLDAITQARPDVVVAFVEMWGPEDWRARHEPGWPDGVSVSPSAVPAGARWWPPDSAPCPRTTWTTGCPSTSGPRSRRCRRASRRPSRRCSTGPRHGAHSIPP